jgi:hypothetical protein
MVDATCSFYVAVIWIKSPNVKDGNRWSDACDLECVSSLCFFYLSPNGTALCCVVLENDFIDSCVSKPAESSNYHTSTLYDVIMSSISAYSRLS